MVKQFCGSPLSTEITVRTQNFVRMSKIWIEHQKLSTIKVYVLQKFLPQQFVHIQYLLCTLLNHEDIAFGEGGRDVGREGGREGMEWREGRRKGKRDVGREGGEEGGREGRN